MLLDETTLDDLTVGATILGSGGGGDPYIGTLVARQAIREHGPVPVHDLADAPDGAWLACVAAFGAPEVLLEKLPRVAEVRAAVDALEAHLDVRFAGLLPVEAGGFNAVLPTAAAAARGVPMFDADTMGRAFPQLEMATPVLHGGTIGPMSLADEHGNRTLVAASTNTWTSRIARAAMIESGCLSMIALHPMTGAQAKRWLLRGTMGRAVRLGATVRRARSAHRPPVDALVSEHGMTPLFTGKVTDVTRRTVGGLMHGDAVLDGLRTDRGHVLRLQFQNEYLLAHRDETPVAGTPDLITTVALDTAEPISAVDLRFGARVAVVGLPSDPQWQTEAGLALVGPRAFGYDQDVVPLG